MAADYIEALRRHSLEVQKIEGEQAAEFLRLLKHLQGELRERLDAAASDETLDAFRIRSVVGETEVGIRALEAKARGQYDKGAEAATNLAIDHLGSELDRLSLAFDSKPLEVTIDAAKALADPAQRLLANHFESSVQRYGIDLLNGVRQRLFVGLRAGDRYGDVVRDVAGEKGPFGQVGRTAGERLVRTETSQAYGAAQHTGLAQAARQVPSLKKVWLHVSSWRCDVCMPIHGTERPIDGTWTIRMGRRTKEVAHAPAHPNCSCRTSGMKSKWRDGIARLGYLDQDKDDSKSSPSRL